MKQYGIIDFKNNGTKATSYKMISLLNNTQVTTQRSTQDKITLQNITQDTTQDSTQDTTQVTTQDSATLNKLDKTKQIVDVDDPQTPMKKTVELFQKAGMGQINQTIADILGDISDNYPYELIEEAFKIAGANHATSIRYVEKILMAWEAKGIKSLEQLEMYRKNRRRDYGSAKGNNGRGNGEEDPYADIGITL